MTEKPVNYGSNNALIDLEKLNRLKERLSAQEKELGRLLARLENLEERRKKLADGIDITPGEEKEKKLFSPSSLTYEEERIS